MRSQAVSLKKPWISVPKIKSMLISDNMWTKMKTAIVILNWNGERMLKTYLDCVKKYKGEAEVIVADNASTDGSVDYLRQHHPDVQLIILDKNYGFAEGYNQALRQVEAEYYVLLNSDIRVDSDWLTPMVAFMDAHPEVAACQPKLLSEHDPESFEYAGACGGMLDRYGYPFCRGRIFDTVEKDHGQYDTPMEILWATGAALLIRSADYWQQDGLDGRFFAHNEEIDLCWRLSIAGRKIYCLPQSHVYHVGGGTLPKANPMKTFLNFRNNLTMLYKCLPDRDLRKVMMIRCVLDYVAALQMLILQRNVGDFKAVIRGRKAFNKWKADFTADRKRIQQSRRTASEPGRVDISILWQYYAKGKKTWDSLSGRE